MATEIESQHHGKSQAEQYNYLLSKYDQSSELEKKLLDYLFNNGYGLPDEAQVNMEDYYINADFYFSEPAAYIFCDGSVHDWPEQIEEDRRKRQLLEDAGYEILVFYYKEKVADFVARYPDIFRKTRKA